MLIYMIYRPFLKTLPRSSAFVNGISVGIYETGCILTVIKIICPCIHTVNGLGCSLGGGDELKDSYQTSTPLYD